MIAGFDAWLGRRLFVPAIVWLCQRAGTTQWRFSNYTWMIASWLLLYATLRRDSGETSASSAAFLLSVYWTTRTARHPDREGYSPLSLRMFFAVGEIIHWGNHALNKLFGVTDVILFWGSRWDISCAVSLIILFAEYALTIRTIPPLPESIAIKTELQELGL